MKNAIWITDMKERWVAVADVLFPKMIDFVEVEKPGTYKAAVKIAAK